jgi:hypothetical protein
MIATGNASTQIVDNRKRLRDDNGEAVKISSSDGKNDDQFGLV